MDFSAKLESKNPTTQPLPRCCEHGSRQPCGHDKASLAAPELPSTHPSPLPLVFVPELKNESKPSLAQP